MANINQIAVHPVNDIRFLKSFTQVQTFANIPPVNAMVTIQDIFLWYTSFEKCIFSHEVSSYLGFTLSRETINYYSKFVHLAILMRHMYDLLKINDFFVWPEACDQLFEKLKWIIASDQLFISTF